MTLPDGVTIRRGVGHQRTRRRIGHRPVEPDAATIAPPSVAAAVFIPCLRSGRRSRVVRPRTTNAGEGLPLLYLAPLLGHNPSTQDAARLAAAELAEDAAPRSPPCPTSPPRHYALYRTGPPFRVLNTTDHEAPGPCSGPRLKIVFYSGAPRSRHEEPLNDGTADFRCAAGRSRDLPPPSRSTVIRRRRW